MWGHCFKPTAPTARVWRMLVDAHILPLVFPDLDEDAFHFSAELLLETGRIVSGPETAVRRSVYVVWHAGDYTLVSVARMPRSF